MVGHIWQLLLIVMHTLLAQELGAAGLTKRPTSCMLVLPKAIKNPVEDEESQEFLTSYEEVAKKVKAVQPIF